MSFYLEIVTPEKKVFRGGRDKEINHSLRHGAVNDFNRPFSFIYDSY